MPDKLTDCEMVYLDECAIAAMHGELASQSPNDVWCDYQRLAERSYYIADAMLAERRKRHAEHSES